MSRPNVLLLITDSQQAATVAPESHCQMPNVARLGEDGTRFTRCYTASPICSPSRATLMTGVLPHTHGMVRNSHVVEPFRAQFRDDVETWSERLDAEGYRLGYVGKWHVERSNDLGKFGFDEYEVTGTEAYYRNFAEHREAHGLSPRQDRSPEALVRSRTVTQPGYDDKLLYGTHTEPQGTGAYYRYSRGIEFIRDQSDADEPWCLTISTDAPHDPFLAPEECYDRYDPADVPKPANFHDPMEDKPELYRRVPAVWDDLSWEEFAEAIAHYYAYCTHVDDQVGRALDALADTDQLEDTVVIFTSDHGDMMGGHRMFTHGFTAFEEIYHSPLVVHHPGVDGGEDCDRPVQVHDIGPTVVDLTGGGEFPERTDIPPLNPSSIARDDAGDGDSSYEAQSLVPFLRGEEPDGHRPEAYAEFDGDSFAITQRIYWRDDLKYVCNMFADDELYDLAMDPAETMNLVDDPHYQSVKRDLAGRMWEIARDTGDYTLAENHYWMNRIGTVGPYEDV